MRIGIFFRTAHPAVDALAAGFDGHEVHFREPSLYRGEIERFDLVIANGWRAGKRVAEGYAAKGIPVLTADFGYLSRVNEPGEYLQGHWQVGLGGLNKIPPFACPPDRFEALGLAIVERGGNPAGPVLVCGQVGGDAAHGLGAHDLRVWLREQLETYAGSIFRPHPRGGIAVPGYASDHRPLAEALADASIVVTYNSNVGHDALLAGVPVVCGIGAAYEELSGTELPSVETRQAYFNRVAYGQWTIAEMASGEAQAFWLNHLLPGKPMVADSGKVIEPEDPMGADEIRTMTITPDEGPASTDETIDLDVMGADELRALAKDRGVKVHARAGAEKIRAALRAHEQAAIA